MPEVVVGKPMPQLEIPGGNTWFADGAPSGGGGGRPALRGVGVGGMAVLALPPCWLAVPVAVPVLVWAASSPTQAVVDEPVPQLERPGGNSWFAAGVPSGGGEGKRLLHAPRGVGVGGMAVLVLPPCWHAVPVAVPVAVPMVVRAGCQWCLTLLGMGPRAEMWPREDVADEEEEDVAPAVADSTVVSDGPSTSQQEVALSPSVAGSLCKATETEGGSPLPTGTSVPVTTVMSTSCGAVSSMLRVGSATLSP